MSVLDNAKEVNSGPGWYEVINPSIATTEIVRVMEDGSIYCPEGVLTRDEFAFAAATGKAHRLIRVDEVVAEHERVLAERAAPPREATTEWKREMENRIHYRYGVNSGIYHGYPYRTTATHEEQQRRLEGETSGPVDVTKRESRVVYYGPWEPLPEDANQTNERSKR